METSRRKVFEDFLGFLVFSLVCGIVMVAGVLCLGVGVLASLPVVIAAQAYGYEDLFGESVTVKSVEPQPAAA
ncbi:MAG: hypothetical protein AUJ92_05010 [Armatimonadetes bacterium CG2_30_59_28]|nr:hypothetical protein [Armatimonadota bacterium]OIO96856.1 MAG: hypothetical protein AUJ92_05010 [Armatimonadetes bacterium CG2_30_59_28]PIU60566.1 MAG: hypothetical protein COS85_23890 [Armatimonadetes bacterium CG07_land_8_20_14_0_80_59_28]PIX44713.1 MAG: hypothetical protein COZ56_03880 [Armatimonadetes bacterium CG_4_8_14_3_um_filter_58_9]PIY48140.1 MAG: hypothetical protein COZ05_04005 [Armatimonadetes bacterium CG_4_10_14_3_um_filter_59_10]PJB78334.1 MAG: hypothetical protein CO095_006